MFVNSVQTVTLNSALSQNWVECTVRTPRTQVARTLRVQCPGRGRCCAHSKLVARMSRAQPEQVERLLGVRWSRHAQAACPRSRPKTQAATPNFNRLGRDLKSMSRPASSLPKEMPVSRPKTLVATSNHNKAARIMSRHQIGVATPLRPLQAATLKRGRDTVFPSKPQARSRHRNQVATPPGD